MAYFRESENILFSSVLLFFKTRVYSKFCIMRSDEIKVNQIICQICIVCIRVGTIRSTHYCGVSTSCIWCQFWICSYMNPSKNRFPVEYACVCPSLWTQSRKLDSASSENNRVRTRSKSYTDTWIYYYTYIALLL